jgi:hypothetical protein
VSGHVVNLLEGLAAHLAAGGIGATWSTSGAYTALQTGILLGSVPQAPDRIITLTAYGVADDPALSDSEIGVQVRCRWGGADPRPVQDLDDAIFALWHGKTNLVVGTGPAAITVVQLLRLSQTSLGQDENRRWSTSSNYLVTTHRPSANRQ